MALGPSPSRRLSLSPGAREPERVRLSLHLSLHLSQSLSPSTSPTPTAPRRQDEMASLELKILALLEARPAPTLTLTRALAASGLGS